MVSPPEKTLKNQREINEDTGVGLRTADSGLRGRELHSTRLSGLALGKPFGNHGADQQLK